MDFDPGEAVAILHDVMRGELDGHPVTTSERIRAASLLMRWYLAGDLMICEDDDDIDPLSRAVMDYRASLDGDTTDGQEHEET